METDTLATAPSGEPAVPPPRQAKKEVELHPDTIFVEKLVIAVCVHGNMERALDMLRQRGEEARVAEKIAPRKKSAKAAIADFMEFPIASVEPRLETRLVEALDRMELIFVGQVLQKDYRDLRRMQARDENGMKTGLSDGQIKEVRRRLREFVEASALGTVATST